MESSAVVSLVPRHSSARLLQDQLKDIEALYDDALIETGELIGKAIRAAREAELPLARIQKPLRLLSASIAKALDARSDAHRFHQDCRVIMRTLNLPELGWGDAGRSPDEWSDGADEGAAQERVPA